MKNKECPHSPTGRHCYCEVSTRYDDFGSTKTERCCWCATKNVERTVSQPHHWSSSGDQVEGHGPHKVVRRPMFSGGS